MTSLLSSAAGKRMTDKQLAGLAQSGVSTAAELLVKRYEPLAQRVAASFRIPGHDQPDLVQISRIAIYRAVQQHHVDRQDRFDALAREAVTNALLRTYRDARQLKRYANAHAVSLDSLAMGSEQLVDTLPGRLPSPEQSLISRESCRAITSLARQNPRDANAFDALLRLSCGASHEENRNELGVDKYKAFHFRRKLIRLMRAQGLAEASR